MGLAIRVRKLKSFGIISQTFITYFETTLGFGSLSMDFPDQYAAGVGTKEARFLIEGSDPYSVSPDGGTLDWKVSFTVEVLP